MKTDVTVIDASGLILGRLASNVAKRIILGEKIVIVNSENAIISGSKKKAMEEFKKRLGFRTLGSQEKAPKRPRRPDNFVRRTIRGMLPWKKPKGKSAYRRLAVYIGVPNEYLGKAVQSMPEAKKNLLPFITVGDLLKTFGWQKAEKKGTIALD